MLPIFKFPRTPHLRGSSIQKGDEELKAVPFSAIASKYSVVEEKVDGANSAISFDLDDTLLLQSRGHYLAGGAREGQFDLLKRWAFSRAADFHSVLGHRYVNFGEWLYLKHTTFYDLLPHYWLEFDLYDRERQVFLSTERRVEILRPLRLCSVPVLHAGSLRSAKELTALLGKSSLVSATPKQRLQSLCLERKFDVQSVLEGTDCSGKMEGLYVKTEEHGVVTARYKFVRAGFRQTTTAQAADKANRRQLVTNLLGPGGDLFSGR